MTESAAIRTDRLSVAVCQLTSIDDVEVNLRQIEDLLTLLQKDPADLICFPENSLYLRVREGGEIEALSLNHPALLRLAVWATKLKAVIHLGSVPIRQTDGRITNSTVLLTETGEVRELYRKIHLFDVDVEGEKKVRESDVFAAGEESTVFMVKGWVLGNSICYDLRFSELFLRYARLEVDAVLIPSAFLVATGSAHWEILVRARAIETQAFVLAAAQGGEHFGVSGGRRSTFGHSMIVGPWGEKLAECDRPLFGQGAILRAFLDRSLLSRVRKQIPMKNHRRLS